MDPDALRAGLKLIAKGIDTIAEGLADPDRVDLTEDERDRGFAREWGEHGLSRREAADLCARWGLPGQKVSAWVRGDWAVIRDGRRYLTDKSFQWLERGDAKEAAAAAQPDQPRTPLRVERAPANIRIPTRSTAR